MGGGTKKTETQESNPWKPSQAGLQSVLARGQELGGKTNLWQPEVGSQTNASLDQLEGLANQGSAAANPLQGVLVDVTSGSAAGFGNLQSTAQGDYLMGNPFFKDALASQLDDVANRTNQQFSGAGRYGSGAHTGALAKNMGDLSTAAFFQNYNTERQNQMNASNTLADAGQNVGALGGQLDQANAYGANLMGQVGAQRDAIATAQKQAPLRATEWQAGLTSPIAGLGGTQTQTSFQPSNTTGKILGGAIMAAGAMSGNPMMIASGAGTFAGGGGGGGGGSSMASGNGTLWPSLFGQQSATVAPSQISPFGRMASMPGRIY